MDSCSRIARRMNSATEIPSAAAWVLASSYSSFSRLTWVRIMLSIFGLMITYSGTPDFRWAGSRNHSIYFRQSHPDVQTDFQKNAVARGRRCHVVALARDHGEGRSGDCGQRGAESVRAAAAHGFPFRPERCSSGSLDAGGRRAGELRDHSAFEAD